MVVQGFVDAGNGLDLLQHRADVVADENNGAILVYLCQQFVEAGFETLVDVCAGFVENHHLRVGDDGTAQEGTLQLSAAQSADGTLLHAFQPMRAITAEAFSRCRAVKREASGFLLLSPERMTSSTVMGNFRSMLLYWGK